MNKTQREFVERWVKALRSGEYKQGQEKLRPSEDTFCCLGVACDLSELSEWEQDDQVFRYDGMTYIPPSEVMNMIGAYRPTIDDLAGMNDGGASFSDIADYIEKKVLAEAWT